MGLSVRPAPSQPLPSSRPAVQRCFCTTFGTKPQTLSPAPQVGSPPRGAQLPCASWGGHLGRPWVAGNAGVFLAGGELPGSQSPTASLARPPKSRPPTCSTYRVTTSWAGGQRLHPVPGRPVVPGRGVASICHHTPHRWPEPCLCSQSWLLRGPSEQGPEPAAWEQTDFSSLPQSQPGLSLH